MIDLTDFAGGAVAEHFNLELQRLLENIADPNTDPKKARSLTVTVTLRGDDARDIANVSVQTKSKLVPAREVETKIILDQDSRGNVVGAELKSGTKGQMFIDQDGEIADDRGNKIVKFNK